MGDPWANPASYDNHCAHVDPTTHKYNPACAPWDASSWNPAVRPLAAAIRNNTAPFYMGPIHPRLKREVGRRLAVTMLTNASGPTIAGCSADLDSSTLDIHFDVANEAIHVQRFDNNASQVSGNDNSGLFACVAGENHPTQDGNANESTCACLGECSCFRVTSIASPMSCVHCQSIQAGIICTLRMRHTATFGDENACHFTQKDTFFSFQ